jgi:phosphoribosylformylglycinamidine cyclo-ligase
MRGLIEKGWVKGLVHVTGGGITENTPRILPAGSMAEVRLGSWPVLPIFELIAKRGRVPRDEMFRVFNMGLGLLIVVGRQDAEGITRELEKKRERFWIVGRIIRGRPSVKYSGV